MQIVYVYKWVISYVPNERLLKKFIGKHALACM